MLDPDDFSPLVPLATLLERLRAADEAEELDEAVDVFLHAWRRVFVRESFKLVHATGVDPSTWADDALAIIMQQVYQRLPQIVRATDLDIRVGLMPFLRHGFHSAWNAFLDSSSGLDGRGGMTTMHRRRMRLNNLRRDYETQLGHTPADDQTFIDWANAEQAKTHKDPKRSGMLFTLEDLQPIDRLWSTDVEGGDALVVTRQPNDADAHLAPLERKTLARTVLARCREESTSLGAVAGVMLASMATDHPDDLPTASEVGRVLGRTRQKVGPEVQRVLEVAKDVLADEFDINGL